MTASSDEDGTVAREVALTVLRRNDVVVTLEPETSTAVLAKGDIVESQELPPRVGRNMLHRFARMFDVGIHVFYKEQQTAEATHKAAAAKKLS